MRSDLALHTCASRCTSSGHAKPLRRGLPAEGSLDRVFDYCPWGLDQLRCLRRLAVISRIRLRPERCWGCSLSCAVCAYGLLCLYAYHLCTLCLHFILYPTAAFCFCALTLRSYLALLLYTLNLRSILVHPAAHHPATQNPSGVAGSGFDCCPWGLDQLRCLRRLAVISRIRPVAERN